MAFRSDRLLRYTLRGMSQPCKGLGSCETDKKECREDTPSPSTSHPYRSPTAERVSWYFNPTTPWFLSDIV